MATVTIDLPIVNQPNATEEPKIPAAFAILRDEFNGNIDNTNLKSTAGITPSKLSNGAAGQLLVCNAQGVPTYVTPTGDVTVSNAGVTTLGAAKVGTTNIVNDAVTDAKLESPNNAVHKAVFEVNCAMPADAAAGTYGLLSAQYAQTTPIDINHSTAHADGGGGTFPTFRYISTNYDVDGLVPRVHLHTRVMTNATASGSTFTFGIYPFTVAGSSNDIIRYAMGTVFSGSTVAHATPAASTISNAGVADIALTTNDYCIGVVVSGGALAANSAVAVSAQVKVNAIAA